MSAESKLVDGLLAVFRELGIPESEWKDMGLDISNTPRRVAKMYRDELLSSYKPGSLEQLKKKFTTFESDGQDALISEGPINFSSLCGHHLLPFTGVVYVGYIPNRKIIGASKIPRVIDYFSKMLQIQERLCRQVAEFIETEAEARFAVVMIIAKHECMRCRGVRQLNTQMITTSVRPQNYVFEGRDVIDEFYNQLKILGNLT